MQLNRLLYYLLVIFLIGCTVRLIPQLMAYPFPIGYDSITYYLPELVKINNVFAKGALEFPVYLYTVNFFSTILSQNLYYSFLASSILLYGIFSSTIFLLSYKVNKQSLNGSFYISVFVIFQLPILRISWDLFRDLFSLIFLNIFLILIAHMISKKAFGFTIYNFLNNFAIFVVTFLTLFSDRMIGIFLLMISFICAIFYRIKSIVIFNLFLFFIFSTYFYLYDKTTVVSIHNNFLVVLTSAYYHKNDYSSIDISILFLTLVGILIPTFIVGIKLQYIKNINIIKIPLIISFIFSFSWIFVPNYSFLAPERWIFILCIYLSIFSVMGFLSITEKISKNLKKQIIRWIFLFAFVGYGFSFAILPYDDSLTLPSFFKNNTLFIFPSTMIFNSIHISDNHDIVNMIDWINSHTPKDSIIYGSKHWRGWFNLLLDEKRTYSFIEYVLPNKIFDNVTFTNNTMFDHYLQNKMNLQNSSFVPNVKGHIYLLYYDSKKSTDLVTSLPLCEKIDFGYFKLYEFVSDIYLNNRSC